VKELVEYIYRRGERPGQPTRGPGWPTYHMGPTWLLSFLPFFCKNFIINIVPIHVEVEWSIRCKILNEWNILKDE
jgi:hypothetical protein